MNTFKSIFREGLFQNKVILITGGGTGIGRCIAHELASLGAIPLITGRKMDSLIKTKEEILKANPKSQVDIQIMNIRNESEIQSVVKGFVEKWKRIDGLVNNAGGQFLSPASNISPKGWRAVIDTNLNGTWWVSQTVFQHAFQPQKSGVIVNIVADVRSGFPYMSHTGASRAGVINLTKTLSQEWAQFGVRVNAVAPGTILSNGMNNYPTELHPLIIQMMSSTPYQRPGTESEVSSVVCFLLSEGSQFVSGDTWRVDGAGSLQKLPFSHPPPTKPVSLPTSPFSPFNSFHLPANIPPSFKQNSKL